MNGSYTLPWQQIQVAGVLQNLPGQQILAQWNITQAEAAAGNLGRPLSGGANTSRVVPLIKPGTMFTTAARRSICGSRSRSDSAPGSCR